MDLTLFKGERKELEIDNVLVFERVPFGFIMLCSLDLALITIARLITEESLKGQASPFTSMSDKCSYHHYSVKTTA